MANKFLSFIVILNQFIDMDPRELGYVNPSNNQPGHYRSSQHVQMNRASRYTGPQQNYQSNISKENLNFSRLQEHNIHYHTDKLYDPLRNTLLHPQTVRQNEREIPQVVRHSYLTKDYKLLTPQEAQNIKRNTYIPRDVDLSQTDHFYKVKDKEFVAVNTETRVIGKSISPVQLERIKQQGVKKSMVVYDLKERVEQVDPITTYTPPPIETYGSKKEYKYNLYSIIDEPMNWVRQFGCSGAKWCVPNEVIASKNQPQSMRWLK